MTETIATEILRSARDQDKTVTTAESCTGGKIAAALTDIAGSSHAFERGYVTYSNAAKMDMLGVKDATLKHFGAVSEEVVSEMAQGALSRAGADIAVAVSGVAGPGGSTAKPEGRVCFALATSDGVSTETVEYGALGRANVRDAATFHGLELIRNALTGDG